jgi:hypothetical protein|tara:strand:- start:631 stop:921 length:291 start_codon:yes stop_codon:yes gene_type:complete
MDKKLILQVEAAVFRTIRDHLQNRSDVQNIDMMNTTGFCRNCLGRWYKESAHKLGIEMTKEESQEIVYGMPASEWKSQYQIEATDDQKKLFKTTHK